MARPAKPSDEIYNLRRKAKRYVASLERQLNKTTTTVGKQALRRKIRETNTAIAKTYKNKAVPQIGKALAAGLSGGRVTASQGAKLATSGVNALTSKKKKSGVNSDRVRANAQAKLETILANTGGKSGKARADAVFKQQMGLAMNGKASSLGKRGFGQSKVKIFYRSTQRLWQGKPASERNKAIIEGLGVSSLDEAFQMVMDANKKSVNIAKEEIDNRGKPVDTESEEFQREEIGESEQSPTYLAFVRFVS